MSIKIIRQQDAEEIHRLRQLAHDFGGLQASSWPVSSWYR